MTQFSTRASLRYLIPSGEKPIYYASEGGADAQLRINASFEDIVVDINDARQLENPASLDKEGFELHSHSSGVTDFYALASQQSFYEAELRELALAITGSNEILVFDHTLRSDSSTIRSQHNSRETASVIHSDYTEASAEKRLRDLLSKDEAAERLQSRFAIINVWRSIAGKVVQTPMTCCDAQTLAEANVIPSERRAKDRIGELELVSFNPSHRWYYYPAMTEDEVLLIKTYDSARDGRAIRSAHTAFHDPSAPADAKPRESIESRMLVFFDH